jgi:hypothetical protein
VSAANGRLLKGYGPLVALLVAFVLMAMMVPTAHQLAGSGSGSGGLTAGSAGGGGGGSAAGAAGTAGATGVSAGSAAGPGAAGGPAGSGGTSGGSASGHSTPCPGRQVQGDPYAPPCSQFAGGNGGATSMGVTGDTINVSYRVTNDPGFQQALASVGGAQLTDSPQDIQRTVQGLTDYFNTHFQFYGRKIKVTPYNGQGSQTNELLGQGQDKANADAITVGQQMHSFAELNGTTEPYADSLAKQHVIALGVPYLSQQWMAQRSPYAWSILTECNDVVDTTTEFLDKELAGQPAQFAGQGLQGKPRKYAIIAPDNPWYQDCANEAVKIAGQHGNQTSDDIQYQLNLSTLSNQAASVISKLSNDGITTIFCGCDPVFPVYLTSRAREQGYNPEWVVAGVALTDTDIVGQLFDQSQWTHAFGVSYAGATLPKQATLGYNAYKAVRPDEPANAVDLIYAQMYMLAIGIQMAGPNLSPQSFEQGMWAYPGSVPGAPNAEFGTWLMPQGHFTPQIDSQVIYWDPNKISTYNNKKGAYVVASPRYRSGQYPTGPPHVFGH